MNKSDTVYVAGHTGLVGSALIRKLKSKGYTNIITAAHTECDLCDQGAVESFFADNKPDYVFLAAARVGGIMANLTGKAAFYYDNTMISTNIINSSYKHGVKKLINLGSSCIYPKLAPQPLKEEYLLTGSLEPTNDAYALAKIGAVKMCRFYNEQYTTNFLSVMPTNIYGPRDSFDLEKSHVLPALIRKIHEAKLAEKDVVLWGDGTPKREFLYVDDLADALVFLMEKYDYKDVGEIINIGTGIDISIKDLASLISEILDFKGTVRWDTEKPNGTPRKLLDVSKMKSLGWISKTGLREGIEKTYQWYCKEFHDTV